MEVKGEDGFLHSVYESRRRGGGLEGDPFQLLLLYVWKLFTVLEQDHVGAAGVSITFVNVESLAINAKLAAECLCISHFNLINLYLNCKNHLKHCCKTLHNLQGTHSHKERYTFFMVQ